MTFASNNTGVSAKILADSINDDGDRMTTFEVTLPKCLLAELNTHRVLSKNWSSSRAIPVGKLNEVESFKPNVWLKNRAGMQAEAFEIDVPIEADDIWADLIEANKACARRLSELGVHKQWANRPNDWHTVAKGVVSGTEWNNLIWLRDHGAAQPEFQELALYIKTALQTNTPELLMPGQWHVPYVHTQNIGGVRTYFDSTGNILSLEDALKISTSCCCQVSYRKMNDTLEKSLDIFEMLINADRVHASPFEHVSTPMAPRTPFSPWEAGVTHYDQYGKYWSGNLQGFIQYRQLIPNHVKR